MYAATKAPADIGVPSRRRRWSSRDTDAQLLGPRLRLNLSDYYFARLACHVDWPVDQALTMHDLLRSYASAKARKLICVSRHRALISFVDLIALIVKYERPTARRHGDGAANRWVSENAASICPRRRSSMRLFNSAFSSAE